MKASFFVYEILFKSKNIQIFFQFLSTDLESQLF